LVVASKPPGSFPSFGTTMPSLASTALIGDAVQDGSLGQQVHFLCSALQPFPQARAPAPTGETASEFASARKEVNPSSILRTSNEDIGPAEQILEDLSPPATQRTVGFCLASVVARRSDESVSQTVPGSGP
jgi:hypothetical protein